MIKFGTGGWRAIVADGFTKANVQRVAHALCTLMKQEGVQEAGVCIGYDRRFLSTEATQWAAEVLAAAGVPCLVLDREAPTPLIMFTVREYALPYGMAVTASHNPAIYNGIKLFTAGGIDASEAVTNRIEEIIAEEKDALIATMPYPEAVNSGMVKEINPANEYIDAILALVDVNAIKNGHFKVALDPMYGVSRTSLQMILSTARCEVEVIHDRHDTLFGGQLPTPNIDTLRALSRFVVENKFDIGIATDGDADRIGVIDDCGAFVHPNKLLTLLYYYLLAYRGWKGPVVRNNSTTHLLDRVAAGFGETCYEVPVGFKHVSAKMEETGAMIGGESSGGLTVRGHIRGKDGIYAATLLVEMLAITNKSLSALYTEITDRFGALYTADADFTMTPEKKEALKQRLFIERALPEFPADIAHVSYTDGCKVHFTNGAWVIARFSGTEPLLRLCAEAETTEAAEALVHCFNAFLFGAEA
ncbi:phosphoglucomutase/phosphomannomutase family protein [Christensenellaceae bacterium OttesenSCG-928-L17]|nr:phosphoglucomutase/phosphomannomutase family protein [Christensenellaceae bacterium OttesenSCG-928-L17]